MLSIPGTHDSAAYHPRSMVEIALEKQKWTMLEQLNVGIRFFDLRVKTNKDGILMTHHMYAECLDLKSTLS